MTEKCIIPNCDREAWMLGSRITTIEGETLGFLCSKHHIEFKEKIKKWHNLKSKLQ